MKVFVTGGTGYIGRRLIPSLVRRGHQSKALVRPGSEKKLPPGAWGIRGDALRMDSYTDEVQGSDTFVHLIGTPHPNPAKAQQFRDVDLVSVQVALRAAKQAGVRQFVYLSVAQPAPVMKAFIEVRSAGEAMIRESGINATFVRPWYVIGPGHRWPYAILPVYWILERLPTMRGFAQRLGLVTIGQMLNALEWSIENPPAGIRIIDVPQIRRLGNRSLFADENKDSCG
ncbi:MAG TPA: NAD(P)H-binding protein [Candidatus Udaeobacter sp.]|nr:NAD(P)H-binding protein [Candidatus Udaeobacter sp.]